MKLPIGCLKCMKELGRPTHEINYIGFCDDGRYETTCSRGHKTITVLQQQRFEVLFEIGAYAIIDRYYRESVSSFAASLERFYEFCIRVFSEKKNLDSNKFERTWKKVSNQSERQLGAFIFLWLHYFQETPKLLSDSRINLRNNVIHKGKIPTKAEAVGFGEAILSVVRPKIKQLQEEFANEVQNVILKHIKECRKVSDDYEQVGTLSVKTIINLNFSHTAPCYEKTLDQYLGELEKWRKIIGSWI